MKSREVEHLRFEPTTLYVGILRYVPSPPRLTHPTSMSRTTVSKLIIVALTFLPKHRLLSANSVSLFVQSELTV